MNDFIQKGAQVLLYRFGIHGGNPYPQVVTVTKVFTKTFEVDQLPSTKFDIRSLTSVGRSSYAVAAADSDKAGELWELHRRESAKSTAMAAVDRWNTGHGRDDLAALDEAITALGHYRGLLAASLFAAETRKGV